MGRLLQTVFMCFVLFIITKPENSVLCRDIINSRVYSSNEGESVDQAAVEIKTSGVNSSAVSNSGIYTKDEQIFNPVLQNYTALEDWMLKNGHGTISSNQAYPRGSRHKRTISPLWCESGNQCARSLCPWEERIDIQNNRTPITVKYAVCLTMNCNFNFAGLATNVQSLLNYYTACDRVRTDIRVMVDGTEHWLTNWPIACICTRRQLTLTPEISVSRHSPSDTLFNSPGFAAESVNNAGSLPNNAERRERPMLDGIPRRAYLTRQERRLIRQYRRQQRRRQNTETWEALMRRRQQERNGSNF